MVTSEKIPTITINDSRDEYWKIFLKNKLGNINSNYFSLDCINVILTCKDIQFINKLSKEHGANLNLVRSNNTETIVSANSLGFKTEIIYRQHNKTNKNEKDLGGNLEKNTRTLFHQGTLHSGEHLESDRDMVLVGDVNPGAMVSARGNIIIWGRLLGIAHAGKDGDQKAKISALQLRPVQLRIANKIARGPQEKPQHGFAEQAEIKSDEIVIFPAKSQ